METAMTTTKLSKLFPLLFLTLSAGVSTLPVAAAPAWSAPPSPPPADSCRIESRSTFNSPLGIFGMAPYFLLDGAAHAHDKALKPLPPPLPAPSGRRPAPPGPPPPRRVGDRRPF